MLRNKRKQQFEEFATMVNSLPEENCSVEELLVPMEKIPDAFKGIAEG